jgi:Na+/H+-dicarboxylate symporter
VRLLFLAHLLGIPLTLERVVIFAATIILISPSTVGVPSVTSGTRSLPAYVAAGIPPEYVVLLGATTSIVDPILTLLNSTGYMTANVVIGRFVSGRAPVPQAERTQPPAGSAMKAPAVMDS